LSYLVRLFSECQLHEEIVITEESAVCSVIADRKEQIDGDVRLGICFVIRRSLKRRFRVLTGKEDSAHLKDYIEHSVTIEHAFITKQGKLLGQLSNASSLITGISQRDWYKGFLKTGSPMCRNFTSGLSTLSGMIFSISIPIRLMMTAS